MAVTQIKVSTNGRYLVNQADTPVFLIGDDAWALISRLTFSEATTYFTTRKAQGFNMVHIWLMTTWMAENENGDHPFSGSLNNTSTSIPLNTPYWNFADSVINLADDNDFYFLWSIGGLLRTAMSNYCTSEFGTHEQHREKTYRVGYAIADRLNGHANMIWSTGMDIHPENCPKAGSSNCANNGANYKDLCKYLAKGIADGWNGATNDYTSTSQNFSTCPPITWHPGNISPDGGTGSGEFFHTDSPDWCSVNMRQSGRQEDPGDDRYLDNIYINSAIDYARTPTKPHGDGEVNYETSYIPDEPTVRKEAYHPRFGAYWNIFAGAAYHCYGNLNVWQMYKSKFSPRSNANEFWDTAINAPGAADMLHVRNLLESRAWYDCVPDQNVFTDAEGSNETHLQAMRESTGLFAFVYSTNGRSFTVDMTKISGTTAETMWFDPRTGETTNIGEFSTTGTQLFNPPGSPSSFSDINGNDYILVLDDKDAGAPPPGAGLSALVAHRGGRLRRPENTLVAMQYAYGLGSNLEMDVRLSSNNVLVLMHDATVNRTTNLSGNVSSFTSSQLAAADAGSHFSSQYAGEGVPTLDSIIGDMMTNAAEHIFAIVDTKTENSTVYNGLKTILDTHNAWNRVYIEVTDATVKSAMQAVDSRFKFSIWAPSASDINTANADPDYERVATHDTLAQYVDEIQAAGKIAQLGVHTEDEWCFNVVPVAVSLPDAVHTDDPEVLKPLIKQYGLEVPDV